MLLSLPSAFGLVGWEANRDANLDPVPAVEAVDLQLEQPSLLELLPGVEQQHPLLESEQQQDLYVQRATSAQGDINVDNLYCGALTNPDGDVVVSGDLCNDGHVIVDRLESSYCRVQSTEVDTLVTPDTLSVDSLAVNGSLTAPANTSCDVVEVAGMRQWASAFLQTFDDAAEAASWRGGRAATCDGDGVLGGGCGSGSQEVTRTVTGLPEHSRLQLEASFLFVDAWRGEHAYAKVDGQHVWLDSYDQREGAGGVDVCGGPTPERRLRIPVSATVAHRGSSVNLTFGSTLPQLAEADGAGCDASWAVDNVEVHTR